MKRRDTRRVDNASDAVARRLHAVVDEQLEDALANDIDENTSPGAQVDSQLPGPQAEPTTEEESPAA